MEVIPAIDLMRGKCVRLLQGRRGEGKDYGEATEFAMKWKEKGAERLHVVDLDAAMGEGENSQAVEAIIGTGLKVQVGGGIRNLETAQKWLDLGVDRIILGTVAVENENEARKITSAFGRRVFVAIDCLDGKVKTRGWLEEGGRGVDEMVERARDMGAGGIISTDIGRDGTMEGPNFGTIRQMVEKNVLPVIASGGITSLANVKKLQEMGTSGIILGKALYEGKLDLKEVIDYVG